MKLSYHFEYENYIYVHITMCFSYQFDPLCPRFPITGDHISDDGLVLRVRAIERLSSEGNSRLCRTPSGGKFIFRYIKYYLFFTFYETSRFVLTPPLPVYMYRHLVPTSDSSAFQYIVYP